MKLKLPSINGHRFARSFVLRNTSRGASEIIDKLGPDGIGWLIEHSCPLCDVLCLASYEGEIPHVTAVFEQKMPQLKQLSATSLIELQRKAQSYSWAAEVVSESDLYNMLPAWAQGLISSEKGKVWWQEQAEWLRNLFGGK